MGTIFNADDLYKRMGQEVAETNPDPSGLAGFSADKLFPGRLGSPIPDRPAVFAFRPWPINSRLTCDATVVSGE